MTDNGWSVDFGPLDPDPLRAPGTDEPVLVVVPAFGQQYSRRTPEFNVSAYAIGFVLGIVAGVIAGTVMR